MPNTADRPYRIWRSDGSVLITASDAFGGGGIEFDEASAIALAGELTAILVPKKSAKPDRRPWTPDDDAKFKRLYESGMTVRKIAEELGRGFTSAVSRLGKLGIANRRPDQSRRLASIGPNRKTAA